jgi:2-polyprenyl-6-methoxyphenol hydroxylase-like FAD-dependent oxidoreductase
VRLRHRCRLERFEASPGGVIADLATAARERVAADYLVACDGANSMVREALGIALAGDSVLGHPAHLFFRAPGLLERCGREPGTFFLAIDRDGLCCCFTLPTPRCCRWSGKSSHCRTRTSAPA